MIHTPWVQTYSGRKVDLLGPTVDQICPQDIAWSLAQLCRFTGATRTFYSVAEHSVLVCVQVARAGGSLATQRAALLHDGTEAYLGDVSRPLKMLVPSYKGIEHHFESIITQRFGLDWAERDLIKTADLRMLTTEQQQLLGDPPVPWTAPLPPYDDVVIAGLAPAEARASFVWHYERLFDERLKFLWP